MNTSELLEKLNEATKGREDNERVLFFLLKEHQKDIEGLIEQDCTGGWFHKAFRQTDVTNSGKIDSSIWILLSQSEVFWEILSPEPQK